MIKENLFLRSLFFAFTLCVFSGLGMMAIGQTKVEFKSTGNTTWTVPNGVTQITIHGIGGGGRGGSASQYAGAGGGGGGAYDVNTVSVTPGEVIYIHVAKGGTSASAPNGEASTASKTSGGYDLLNANGGQVGGSASSDRGGSLCSKCASGAGGAGGAASGRAGSIAGGRGANGQGNDYKGGGGGGAAGPGFTPATDVTTALNGRNGFDYDDNNSGDGGKGGTTGVDHGGYSGHSYGGGGGGAMTGTSVSYAGADGAQGVVWITYYVNDAVNVTFNANMPQNDNNMNNAIPANGSINYGNAYGSILDWRDPSYQTARRGYTFTGWNTAADGSGTTITATSVAGTSDVTLYAQWVPVTMTVTFDVNEGSWTTQPDPNPFLVTYGETYRSKTGWDWQVPSKSGYLFQGWKLQNGSMYFGPDSKVNQIANHTLVAEWVAEENLPTTKTVCYEDVVSLCAPSGYSGYTWTPTAGLSDATSQCPTLTAADMTNASVQYKCNYTSGSVYNGDFSQGNVGFSSDYDIVNDASDVNNELQPERKVSTTTCWHNVHNTLDSACTLKSYEGDNGLFLAVNGGKFPNEVVWEQTVTVAKNTKYRISVQCAAASQTGDAAPAKLLFFVNDTCVSTDTTKVTDHTWQEMFVEWQNTNAIFATIAIKDFTDATGGNDFAIDHVVVEAIDGLGKEYDVDITRRNAFNAGAIATTGQTRNYGAGSNNTIGSITAATGGDNIISYQWYQDSTAIEGATSETYIPTVSEPGTYVFTRKAKDGTCVELTASTGSWTLTINNLTVAVDSIKGAKVFCAGDSTTLTAFATASQGTPSYKWLNTGETTPDIKVKTAGEYKVVASVTVGSITVTDTASVTVTANPLPVFTITTTPESCKGHDGKSKVSLSGEGITYAWSNGDDAQELDTLTSLVNGGIYTVTVTDANGCSQIGKDTITLNNTLEMDPITGPIVCTGTEFNIFPDDVPMGTTYSWPAPDSISGISGFAAGENQNSIHGVLSADPTIITSPTEVQYTVTPKNGVCVGNAVGVTVTVTTIVNPGVTITIPAAMTKCASAEVEIPAEFVNSVTPHSVKWVLKGTTDTITHANLAVNKDTLRLTLPETCSAEYSYLVFDADNSGCVANDGCVITVNSGTWNLPANAVDTVACGADADTYPASTELPNVVDGCGNTLTPTVNGVTRYLVKNPATGNNYLTKVVYKYRYTSCDGTKKTWSLTKLVNYLDPKVTCETNKTVNTDEGENYATMTFENPVVWDSCETPSVKVTYSPNTPVNATETNASGQYPMGTTTVTYTVTNKPGLTASCSFTVTVSDNEDPTIVAPADITVDCYDSVPAPYTTLEEFIAGGGTVSDNVAIDSSSFRYTEVSDGNKCPETFIRAYFISDKAGNEASDTMLVVVNDSIAPTFTAPKDTIICRNTADGSFDANTSVTGEPDPATFKDNNSAVANLTLSYTDLDTLPADETDLRTIRRQWVLLDECLNGDTLIQNISIFPAITAEKAGFACPADINEILPFGQCEMEVNIGEATYGDFFGQTLVLTNNAPADNIYPEGVTTVTWTLTDECGFSISCDQTITVTFPECPVAVDADGNEYESVRIGCDCWTKRNLESLTYSDDTEIPGVYNYVSDVYPNEAENVANFGRLYDWASVIKDGADNEYGHVQGICPEGWYLPTAEKFAELSTYGADALKSPNFWLDGGGSNTTGFTSLPAGYYDGSIDRYMNLMGEAYYWSASKVDDEWTPVPCNIRYICNQVIGADYMSGLGYSVRCIKEKDAETAPEPVFECGTSTISDVDGNTYNTVKIGDQCWMKENLKTTKKPNGDAIEAGISYPNDNVSNVATYGLLYTWATMMNGATSSEANPSGVQGICPDGWHVPSDAEWTALTTYVSGQTAYQCDGNSDNIAKALASKQFGDESTVDCAAGYDLENNNATGFSALAAGYGGDLDNFFSRSANFWSATNDPTDDSMAYYRYIYNIEPGVTANTYRKECSFSVRCLKD